MPTRPFEYRCLLISPSDVTEEREELTRLIAARWNPHVGRALGAQVELVRWESHAVPEMGDSPQGTLNRQIVDDCDMGIAVFWTRLGTPTADHASGSVEEIARLVQRKRRVMVYFAERAVPYDVDVDQFSKVKSLRAQYEADGLLNTFSETSQLTEQVMAHLTTVVAELLVKGRGAAPVVPSSGLLTAPIPDVRVTVAAAWLDSPIRSPSPALLIGVHNYSPIPVHLNTIYIERSERLEGSEVIRPGIIVPRGDYWSEIYWRPRTLEPGRKADLSIGPDQLWKYPRSELICASVSDDIGRVYRSSTEELARALNMLFDDYLGPGYSPGMGHE